MVRSVCCDMGPLAREMYSSYQCTRFMSDIVRV